MGGASNNSLNTGSNAASAFVQSHRISNKIRGHLLAYQQPVPPLITGPGNQPVLGPLPKVKAQNNTKAKKGTDMTHSRRNQSPLITMNSMQDNQTSTQTSIYA